MMKSTVQVIPVVGILLRALDRAEGDLGVIGWKARLRERVMVRLGNVENENIYSVATLLDPRWEMDWNGFNLTDFIILTLQLQGRLLPEWGLSPKRQGDPYQPRRGREGEGGGDPGGEGAGAGACYRWHEPDAGPANQQEDPAWEKAATTGANTWMSWTEMYHSWLEFTVQRPGGDIFHQAMATAARAVSAKSVVEDYLAAPEEEVECLRWGGGGNGWTVGHGWLWMRGCLTFWSPDSGPDTRPPLGAAASRRRCWELSEGKYILRCHLDILIS